MSYFPPNCSWCGHAPHDGPCDRQIETRKGAMDCPCVKSAHTGESLGCDTVVARENDAPERDLAEALNGAPRPESHPDRSRR